jgi:hypothetical protein
MSLISLLCPICMGDQHERDHDFKCRPVPGSDAMTDVTDERLAEFCGDPYEEFLALESYKGQGKGWEQPSFIVTDEIRAMARELLQRRRASDRWIPWKRWGTPQPQPDQLYWCATFTGYEGVFGEDFYPVGVTAYWSRPLPAPFDSSMGDQHG